jgi:hypothetical protein
MTTRNPLSSMQMWLGLVVASLGIMFAISKNLADDSIPPQSVPLPKLSKEDTDRIVHMIDKERWSELSQEEANSFVEDLRNEFPYVSLRTRLQYEQAKTKFEAANPTNLAKHAFDDYPNAKHTKDQYSFRADSLRALHRSEVNAFIRRDGMGYKRGVTVGAFRIRIPDRLVKLDSVPSHIDVCQVGQQVELPANEAFALKELSLHSFEYAAVAYEYKKKAIDANPLLMLDKAFLLGMHRSSKDRFLSPRRFGDVIDKDRVSGFLGHGLIHRPPSEPWDLRNGSQEWLAIYLKLVGGRSQLELYFGSSVLELDDISEAMDCYLDTTPQVSTWLIRNMQLVSLLKYERPQVYVSENFPNMNELREADTRMLDDFEAIALTRLAEGEDVVIDSHENRIRMLGSIRATSTCMACHTVPEQFLLGAFSYDLVRNR